MRGGERVALLGAGERPATGRYGMETLIRCLVAAAADQRDSAGTRSRRSRGTPGCCFCRTFCCPSTGCASASASSAALGARACLMQIVDPAEEELPYEGRVLFEGTEREGQALIDHVGGIRARYAELFHAHRESLAGIAGRQGWRFTSHRTDGTAERALSALMGMLAPRMVA